MEDKMGWVPVPLTAETGFDAYETCPQTPNGHVLVLLHEIFGVNVAIRKMCERLAGEGYHVLAPDLFWRIEPHIDLGYDKEGMERALSLPGQLDEERAAADIAATVAIARQRVPEARGVHLLGFCMGGKLAVLGAASCDVASAVSFYGVGVEKIPEALRGARCPLLLHYGDKDQYIPMDAIEQVIALSHDCRNVTVHVYPGAGHGFFSPARAVHHPEAARLAWERTEALFAKVES